MRKTQTTILLIILGYLVISIFFGISNYNELGELSTTYIVTQVAVFIIAVFLNLKLQKNKSLISEMISTVCGGIALMVILQAVLFWLVGDAITSELSMGKKILLGIIGLIGMGIVFKYFTKDAKNSFGGTNEFGLNKEENNYASRLNNFIHKRNGTIPTHNITIIAKTIYTLSTKRINVKSFEDVLFSDIEIGFDLLMNHPEITNHSDLTGKLPQIVEKSFIPLKQEIKVGKSVSSTERLTQQILANILQESQTYLKSN